MKISEDNLWLLDCAPRPVQIEALRRSYLGYKLLDSRDGDPIRRPLRPSPGPVKGWGHFMQMRLGKTPTLLNEFMLARRDFGYRRLCVLAPNSYKNTWGLEIEKFGVKLPVHIAASRRPQDINRFLRQREGIIIANYEIARTREAYVELTEWMGPETFIAADESIIAKGHDSMITQGAINLAKECGIRRAMSGKPISQGPHDIWAQLRFIGGLSGYLYHPFKTHFCKMGGFKRKEIVGAQHEDELAAIIDSQSFRARRSDWMDHFAVDYSEMLVPMEPKQAELYHQMDHDMVTWLNEEQYVKAEQIITKLMKLQQISSGFIIDEMKQTHDLVDPAKNPKALQVASMLENEIEGKAIVAVHYKHSIDILQKALAKFNPAVIRGRQDAGKDYDVDEQKNKFNNDPKCRVIIGQIQATKYGHTLVGTPKHPCTTTLMYENTFSLDDRSQIEERNQGVGQLGPTSVVDFICSKNDLRPIKALQRKEDVAAALLGFKRETGVLPYER